MGLAVVSVMFGLLFLILISIQTYNKTLGSSLITFVLTANLVKVLATLTAPASTDVNPATVVVTFKGIYDQKADFSF
jgi:hypothetical protein